MAAEVNLHGWREPAEIERTIVAVDEEGGLREVHLTSDSLHPRFVGRTLQQADRGRVAAEGLAREGVDLGDCQHRWTQRAGRW